MTNPTTIEEAVAAADLGTPTTRKSGRDARWPYVPVIRYTTGGKRGDGYDEQIVRLAYATRDEAIAAAAAHIETARTNLAAKLVDPRYRALREQYGLPREVVA